MPVSEEFLFRLGALRNPLEEAIPTKLIAVANPDEENLIFFLSHYWWDRNGAIGISLRVELHFDGGVLVLAQAYDYQPAEHC